MANERRALPGETEVLGVLTFLPSLNISSPLPCGASVVIGQVASRLPVRSDMQKTVEYTNNSCKDLSERRSSCQQPIALSADRKGRLKTQGKSL